MPKRIPRNRKKSGASPLHVVERSWPHIEKAAVSLFRWATTDHSGFSQALRDMPPMGFIDTLKYLAWQLLFLLFSAAILGIASFVLIAYVLPFALTALLTW